MDATGLELVLRAAPERPFRLPNLRSVAYLLNHQPRLTLVLLAGVALALYKAWKSSNGLFPDFPLYLLGYAAFLLIYVGLYGIGQLLGRKWRFTKDGIRISGSLIRWSDVEAWHLTDLADRPSHRLLEVTGRRCGSHRIVLPPETDFPAVSWWFISNGLAA